MKFICPKCSLPLSVSENGSAVCKNSHSFDRSKEGYYNLLLSNTKNHGDNRDMVLARRNFLDTGAYLPLAKRISELVCENFKSNSVILDAGCGEGYYTDIIERALTDSGIDAQIIGFDISKDAVRVAAKKNRRLSLAVASAYHMPFADGTFDGVVNLFSPLALSETVRVIKPHGKFIMAIPAEEHLYGLKSVVYDTPYKNEVADFELEGLQLKSSERISYTLNLTSKQDIESLFMMTPYAYRTRKEDRERVYALDSLETQADFIVLVYEKP